MSLLLLIAGLILLFVPGLFAAQATVGIIILGVLLAVVVAEVVAVLAVKRQTKKLYDRW